MLPFLQCLTKAIQFDARAEVSDSKAMAAELSRIAGGWRLVAKLAKREERWRARNGQF